MVFLRSEWSSSYGMIGSGEKMHGSRLRYFLRLTTLSVFAFLAFGTFAMADDKLQSDDPALIKVAITEPSAKAIAFYEGGQWVWAGSQILSVVIPLIIFIISILIIITVFLIGIFLLIPLPILIPILIIIMVRWLLRASLWYHSIDM